jgi:hypothetical protein
MADAKPVRTGAATKKTKKRNTGRPVRAGLVQLKDAAGLPVEAGLPAPSKKPKAAPEPSKTAPEATKTEEA